jgi:hypothetical protein
MRPINFLGAAPAATKAAGAATDAAATTRAAELAKAAAAARAARAAGAAGGGGKPPPPPPKKSKAEVVEGEETITVEPRVEDLRAQQRAAREANPVPQFLAEKSRPTNKLARVAGDVAEVAGWTTALGPIAGPLVGSAVDRLNEGGRRTTAQTISDAARAPLVGSMIEDVVGSDRYSRAKAAVSEYVPDVVRSAASYVPPILAGPFGLTAPATAVAFAMGGDAEKRNIAGREVVVYPKYAEMRARDTGPARLAREAREADTPQGFEWRRNNLRMAFGLAKMDYDAAEDAANQKREDKRASPKVVEDAALRARAQLQKVVDLREALRELQEPEDKLSID